VGSGTTAQSAKRKRLVPSGETIRKKLDTVLMPALRGKTLKPARSTSAVAERLPHTPTSTSPRRTIMAAAPRGQPMSFAACSPLTGLPLSLRSWAKVSAFLCSRSGVSGSTTAKAARPWRTSLSLRRRAKGEPRSTGSARPSALSRAAASRTRPSRLSGKTTAPGLARQAATQRSRMSMP